ncbi:hypothetical protein D3C87_907010 [compost metagenome]
MADREERMLTEYFQECRIAEQRISEFDLNAAISRGIERGSHARRRAGYAHRWRTVAGALAFCLILFMLIRVGLPNLAPAEENKFTAPEYVTAQIKSNQTWLTAANHGLYQPLNQTIEKNGYHLTLDGALADNVRVILFYTSENKSGGSPLTLTQYTAKDDSDPNLSSADKGFPAPGSDPISYGKVQHGYMILSFPRRNTPDTFTLDTTWRQEQDTASQQLSMQVALDSSKFKNLVRTINFGKFISVHNQGMTLEKANLYPLTTELTFDFDSGNVRILSFLYPSLNLNLGSTDKAVKYQDYITNNKGPDKLYFEGIYYDNFSNLTFSAKGIEEAVGENLQITVDTATSKLIKAPDERLSLHRVKEDQHNETDIYFSFSGKILPADKTNIVSVDSIFTDGLGNQHKIADADRTNLSAYSSLQNVDADEKRRGDLYEFLISLNSGKYPQPLTFNVTSYPGTYFLSKFSATP